MTDRQASNTDWAVAEEDGNVVTWERASLAVLMDIRGQLRQLNRLLACDNFLTIPAKLAAIQKNTTKRRTRKARR